MFVTFQSIAHKFGGVGHPFGIPRGCAGANGQRRVSGRVGEEIRQEFPQLDVIGGNGFYFEVPKHDVDRIPDSLSQLPGCSKESVFDTTDVEWALTYGKDG